MTPIERVARKICAARAIATQSAGVAPNGHLLQLDEFVDLAWPLYRFDAVEAIKAMQEPTDAMLGDAQEALGYEVEFIEGGGNFKFCTNDLRDAHRAMIDAALQEK